LPEKQRFRVVGDFLYYDHVASDDLPHTWVLDIRTQGWIWDTYTGSQPTAHASNEGESQQGTLVGCSDGTVRLMLSDSPETVQGAVLTAAIGGTGWMDGYEFTCEYSCDTGATVSFLAADVGNGSYAPNPIVLAGTNGEITKFTTKVSPNKWKLLQAQFSFTDPTLQVYLAGTGLSVKPWGSPGEFKFEPFFGASGGRGPQE
jgi:hypothetical protein